MDTPDSFDALVLLANAHQDDAAAGEVFLALEDVAPHSVVEYWRGSFGHSDREVAVVVEHACASRWADRDLPAMAKAVLLEHRSAQPVKKMAASLLGRLPHEEAWTLLASLPGETEAFRFDYLAVFAVTDPHRALALLPSLERGFHGGEGRGGVIRAAAAVSSPQDIMDWLKKTRAGASDAQAAASVFVRTDPAAALHIARWLAADGLDHDADQTAATIFREWAMLEPHAAGRELIAWMGGTESRTPVTSWYTGMDFEPVTGHVFRAWAMAAPEEALAGACSLPQEHMRRIALNSVALGWPAPEEGLRTARELPLTDRLAFLELISKTLARSNPDMLREELRSLPLPVNAADAAILRRCWKQLSEDEALDFEKRAPQLFENELTDIRSIVEAAISSVHNPQARQDSLARVRSILGQSQS